MYVCMSVCVWRGGGGRRRIGSSEETGVKFKDTGKMEEGLFPTADFWWFPSFLMLAGETKRGRSIP